MGPYEASIIARYREARAALWPAPSRHRPARQAPPPPPPPAAPPPVPTELAAKSVVLSPAPHRERPPGPFYRHTLLADIVHAAAATTGNAISSSDIMADKRTADVVPARHRAMFLLRMLTTLSYPAIGRVLGNRDHTTVLSGARKVALRLRDDAEERARLDGCLWLLRHLYHHEVPDSVDDIDTTYLTTPPPNGHRWTWAKPGESDG